MYVVKGSNKISAINLTVIWLMQCNDEKIGQDFDHSLRSTYGVCTCDTLLSCDSVRVFIFEGLNFSGLNRSSNLRVYIFVVF